MIPIVCRLCSFKGFHGVLYGRDLAGIFKNGHVYDVMEVMGEIIIRDLGEHAIPEYLENNGLITGTISQLAVSGVPMLTKQEYKQQKENNDTNNVHR